MRNYSHAQLPVPTEPVIGESLPGFIARACARNGYYEMRRATMHAGHTGAVGSLCGSAANWARLAYTFGCHEAELVARRHPVCRIEGLTRGFENFFGSPVRLRLRETKVRRVSPASLRVAPYHRAAWLLKPLQYCPEAGDRLISVCPNCSKTLRWTRTVGVEFCEHCLDDEDDPKTDLRYAITEQLPVQDFALYTEAAKLVVPSRYPSKIAPRRLRGWAYWEIFDMIVTLTMILERRSRDFGALGFNRMYENLRFHQNERTWHQSFMLAARTVADWPKALEEIIDLMMQYRDDQGRFNAFGRMKEIGPLAYPDDLSGTPKIAAEISDAVDRVYPRLIRRSIRARRRKGAHTGS